jgi:hypothetical protein
LDVSRFRVGDWVLVAAGTVMLILGLALHWATIDAGGQRVGGTLNAFDFPFTGGIAWLLTVASGVLAFLLAGRLVHGGTVPWTRVQVVAGAVATLLMLVRLLLGAGDDFDIGNQRVSVGRGSGMYVALLAAVAGLVGAILNHRAEGGTWHDLRSADSWRAAGGSPRTDDADSPLPPPPPGTPPVEPTS